MPYLSPPLSPPHPGLTSVPLPSLLAHTSSLSEVGEDLSQFVDHDVIGGQSCHLRERQTGRERTADRQTDRRQTNRQTGRYIHCRQRKRKREGGRRKVMNISCVRGCHTMRREGDEGAVHLHRGAVGLAPDEGGGNITLSILVVQLKHICLGTT